MHEQSCIFVNWSLWSVRRNIEYRHQRLEVAMIANTPNQYRMSWWQWSIRVPETQ